MAAPSQFAALLSTLLSADNANRGAAEFAYHGLVASNPGQVSTHPNPA